METLVYGSSVRGDSHFISGIECQDSNSFSESDFSEDGVKVIAVSDGHGNALYRRSAQGSAFAASIAKKELYDFVNREKKLLDEITDLQRIVDAPPPQLVSRCDGIKQDGENESLTECTDNLQVTEGTEDAEDTENVKDASSVENASVNTAEILLLKDRIQVLEEIILKELEEVKATIITEWRRAVDQAFSVAPIDIVEASVTEFRSVSAEPKTESFVGYGTVGEGNVSFHGRGLSSNVFESLKARPRMLYGATLIASAQYGEHVFIIQLGDGDATVVFEDGRVEAPIAKSGRLSGQETYSLCQSNPLEHFYSAYLRDNVSFIMLSTDGISDALENKEALFDIAAELRNTVEEDAKVFREELRSLLRYFSSGSGDDCTVCFIANGVSEEAYGAIKDSAETEDKAPDLPRIPIFEDYILNRELYRATDTDAVDAPFSEKELSGIGREAFRNSFMRDRYVELIDARKQLGDMSQYRKLLFDVFNYGKLYLDNVETDLNTEQEDAYLREVDRLLSVNPIRLLSFRVSKMEMDADGEVCVYQGERRASIVLRANGSTLEIAEISNNTFDHICNDLKSIVSFNGSMPITEGYETEINNYRITVKKEN